VALNLRNQKQNLQLKNMILYYMLTYEHGIMTKRDKINTFRLRSIKFNIKFNSKFVTKKTINAS
jgi:hypothetical protein